MQFGSTPLLGAQWGGVPVVGAQYGSTPLVWPSTPPAGPTFVGFDGYLVAHDPQMITPPAGTVEGDLCVVAVVSGESSAAQPPAGFTAGDDLIQGGYARMRTGWKILTAGEAASLTLPGDDNFNQCRYGVWTFRGAAAGAHAIAGGASGAGSSVITTPSITVAAGSIVVALGGGRDPGTAWTDLPPTHIVDWAESSGFVAAYGAHYLAAGGATGTQTVTNTGIDFQQWLASAVEIAAA